MQSPFGSGQFSPGLGQFCLQCGDPLLGGGLIGQPGRFIRT
jgi:hypothetical protein